MRRETDSKYVLKMLYGNILLVKFSKIYTYTYTKIT